VAEAGYFISGDNSEGSPATPVSVLYRTSATVGMGPRSEGGFGIDVELAIALPGLNPDAAQALIDKAHQVCPYSNATRNNVPVRLKLI
jgi:organic hydroperoxide reductase OsmC/OhrA